MRVWITSFLVLFGMVDLYRWVGQLTLPLPIFILGGALLAIASNYGKLGSDLLRDSANQASPLINTNPSPLQNSLNSSGPQLTAQTRQSISFVINRATEQHRKAELD